MSESRSKHDALRGTQSPKAVFCPIQNDRWSRGFQSSDLVQTPSRGTCAVRDSGAPLRPGGRGAGLMGRSCKSPARNRKVSLFSLSSKAPSLLAKFSVADEAPDT